jgi:hypothetical protein
VARESFAKGALAGNATVSDGVVRFTGTGSAPLQMRSLGDAFVPLDLTVRFVGDTTAATTWRIVLDAQRELRVDPEGLVVVDHGAQRSLATTTTGAGVRFLIRRRGAELQVAIPGAGDAAHIVRLPVTGEPTLAWTLATASAEVQLAIDQQALDRLRRDLRGR